MIRPRELMRSQLLFAEYLAPSVRSSGLSESDEAGPAARDKLDITVPAGMRVISAISL